MRVLHISTEFPPVIYGGLGTAVGGWVIASARGGFTIGLLLVSGSALHRSLETYGTLGDLPTHAPSTWERWASRRMPSGHGRIRFFFVAPESLIESSIRVAILWKPDAVHLHSAGLWIAAKAIRERAGVPVIYHLHSLDRAEQEMVDWTHSTRTREQEQAIDAADRLIVLSKSERDLLASYYPSALDRVRVIGNGIDHLLPTAGVRIRRRSSYAPLILFCGRFVERKGLRELLAAIPLVLEEAPTTRFVLVGGTGWQTAAEVERRWLPPGLAVHRSQVHFTGWLQPEDLAHWYQVADILTVPSWYEPFGMVVLEGMLYGLAIAASRVGGPAEILEHEHTALLFPPRSISCLARTLIRLVKDPALRRSLGAEAAKDVRRNWQWPRMVNAMRGVLEELVKVGKLRAGREKREPEI
jgi:glycosyltransferase involved in cell wall biosynthesis